MRATGVPPHLTSVQLAAFAVTPAELGMVTEVSLDVTQQSANLLDTGSPRATAGS